jgi:hypothetical protein
MALDTLQDVVEYLADQANVYGAHDEENDEACKTRPCRVCWTEEVTDRIWQAVRLEQQLERGRELKG